MKPVEAFPRGVFVTLPERSAQDGGWPASCDDGLSGLPESDREASRGHVGMGSIAEIIVLTWIAGEVDDAEGALFSGIGEILASGTACIIAAGNVPFSVGGVTIVIVTVKEAVDLSGEDRFKFFCILEAMKGAVVEGVMMHVNDTVPAGSDRRTGEQFAEFAELIGTKFTLGEEMVVPVEFLGHGVESDERGGAEDVQFGEGGVRGAEEGLFEFGNKGFVSIGSRSVIMVAGADECLKAGGSQAVDLGEGDLIEAFLCGVFDNISGKDHGVIGGGFLEEDDSGDDPVEMGLAVGVADVEIGKMNDFFHDEGGCAERWLLPDSSGFMPKANCSRSCKIPLQTNSLVSFGSIDIPDYMSGGKRIVHHGGGRYAEHDG